LTRVYCTCRVFRHLESDTFPDIYNFLIHVSRLYNFKNIGNIHNIYLHIPRKDLSFRIKFRPLLDYYFTRKFFVTRNEKALSLSYITSDILSSHPPHSSIHAASQCSFSVHRLHSSTHLRTHWNTHRGTASVSLSNSFLTLRFSYSMHSTSGMLLKFKIRNKSRILKGYQDKGYKILSWNTDHEGEDILRSKFLERYMALTFI
jgi:hypothetical protein